MEESDNPLTVYWEQHLSRYNKEEVSRIQSDYPRTRILTIDVSKITNNEVWDETLKVPAGQFIHILDALRRRLPPADHSYDTVKIRFVNVTNKRKIKQLRTKDEIRLTSIKALVKRSSEVRPKVNQASFICPAGHTHTVNPKFDIKMRGFSPLLR